MMLSSFLSVYAGGLLTNTNQSVHFLRNPARGASMEIDAVYTNPAGLAKLSTNGFHFSVNNQSAFQVRTITSTFAPFALNGSSEKEFEGKASAPIIPSLFAAYKMDKWVISANIGVIGGGGKAIFEKGLPSFESQIAAPIAQLSGAAGIPTTYTLDSRLEGSSITYGVQVGATYKINEMFSAYVGGRVNLVNNGYEGYLRNINIAAADNLITYFTTAAGQLGQLAGGLEGLDATYPLTVLPPDKLAIYESVLGDAVNILTVGQAQGILNDKAAEATGAAAGVEQLGKTNLDLDTKQTGFGVTPIIGFNFNWEKLNVGVKYEFITKIELENDTKVNATPVTDFDHKVKTPYDIPALLTIGAQYEVTPSIKVSAGYHHFFDSDAKMANDKQKYIDGGMNEYLLGVEWQINPMFLVSAGGQVSRTGVTHEYQADMSYSLNSYSIGFGGAVNITEKIRVNLAYFFTNYEKWTKEYTNYYNVSPPEQPPVFGKDVFSRTNQVFGIGVDFRL